MKKHTFHQSINKFAKSVGSTDMHHKKIESKHVSILKLETIIKQLLKPLKGLISLSSDKEALFFSTAEMKGAHNIPSTIQVLSSHLNNVLQGVVDRIEKISPIEMSSKQRDAKYAIKRVNDREDEAFDQQKWSTTREIKVLGLSHKRAEQGFSGLPWVMFHKICEILRCIHKSEMKHNKETRA